MPSSAEVKHSLALCYMAAGDLPQAAGLAAVAVKITPGLWQSHALLARIARESGNVAVAEAHWKAVLQHSPGNGTALLGLANIAMNELGDPARAKALVASLHSQPNHAQDAALTDLMASLYIGDVEAGDLSARLAGFARANLSLPRRPATTLRRGRRRIGLFSTLFSASPVYYLTVSTWAAVAREHDLIFLNRGVRNDWATEQLRGMATEWIDLAHLDAPRLAEAIAAAEIDILFDMGGWSDAIGLAALSAKPAARQYKWVGGQSATTGLATFDGWIGDGWQSPPDLQGLYTEPLIQIAGGYVDYSPPPFLEKARSSRQSGVALVGNPAKIGGGMLQAWPDGVDKVALIDRRYAQPQTLARVTDLLARAGIAVAETIVPEGQDAYLQALGRFEAIVNTQPYAAGLTAVEAHALGLRLLTRPGAGKLFASRHHLSHLRTGGRNPALAPQILALIAGG